MSSRRYPLILTVLLLCLFIAGICGVFIWQYNKGQNKTDLSQLHGTLLKKPREIEPFSLRGYDNKPFTNQNLQGQWTLVFFGFTRCGYLCPTTLSELAKMYRILEQKDMQTLPHVVLISVDSERDTSEILKKYVTAFHPAFYAATGDEAQLKRMTHEMGLMYGKVTASASGDSEDYDIQHSGAVILFNPNGELAAFFTTPHKAEHLAQDFQLLFSQF